MTHRRARLALVLVLVAGLASPASAQTGTSATADRGAARPGESIVVTGSGWPEDGRVQISICGNEALAGSADCDLPGSRTVQVRGDGTFEATLDVGLPPSPCPCVVYVLGQSTPTPVRFPFEVIDAAVAPSSRFDFGDPLPTFRLIEARISGSGPWSSWFGFAASRDLVLTIHNVGARTATPDVDVAWGSGDSPTHFVDVPAFEPVPPGVETTLRVPVRLDALTFGTKDVVGSLRGPTGRSEFRLTTSTFPWGLVLLPVVTLVLVGLAVVLRARRDEDGADEREDEGDDAIIDLREDKPVAADSQEIALSTPTLEAVIGEELAVALAEMPSADSIDEPEKRELVISLAEATSERVAKRAVLDPAGQAVLTAEIKEAVLAEFGVPTRVER